MIKRSEVSAKVINMHVRYGKKKWM